MLLSSPCKVNYLQLILLLLLWYGRVPRFRFMQRVNVPPLAGICLKPRGAQGGGALLGCMGRSRCHLDQPGSPSGGQKLDVGLKERTPSKMQCL